MNRFIDTTLVGFSAMLAQAVALVPMGFYLCGVATLVLFQNEAREDWGSMVSDTVVGPTAPDAAFDGINMTVTAPLNADRPIGDPLFFEPGPFVTVIRSVETYSWVERVSETVDRKWGGSADITTETTYHLEWTAEPPHTADFRYPDGHENPRPRFDDHFTFANMQLGGWTLNPAQTLILTNEPVLPDSVRWTEEGAALRYVVEPDGSRGAYYYGDANAAAPQLGDTRMTFHVVPSGVTMTAVGYGAGHTIGGLDWFKGLELVPVVPGSRQDVENFMGGLFQITRWLGRIGGVVAVFFGLWLLIGPLFAVLDIAPPIGLAARIIAGLVVVPAALAWSGIVIIFSQILHSWVMLTLLAFLLYLWLRTAIDRRRERRANDRVRAFHAAREAG